MTLKQLYAVVSGNPVKGFTLDGPFDSEDEALEWASDTFDNPYWWTAPLQEPEFNILEACTACGSYTACDCDDKILHMPTPPVPSYTLDG